MNPLSYIDPGDPYPESDGQPMAENTEQYDWIVKIKENLEILFADDDDVFIAGDLLWYPVPDRRLSGPIAPDVLVAFGRPKGRRGSYLQWQEEGIAPQVVSRCCRHRIAKWRWPTSCAFTTNLASKNTICMIQKRIIWKSGCGKENP